jgi:hypothetical protein
MKKCIITAALMLLIQKYGETQPILTKIAKIAETNQLADNIRITGNTRINLDITTFNNAPEGAFDVINNRGEIWLTQNGSNKVYKLGRDGKAKRLDRTFNRGFNFGAINLFYRDTLYSIGGYGFWQTTGSIRYFNPNTGEWDIVRNIKNVPIASGINSICHYDKLHGKLFVIYSPTRPEYEKYDENTVDEILMQCFDFQEKSWWEDAKQINPKIAKKISDLTLIQNYTGIAIISSKINGKAMSVNFNNNKINEVDYKYHTELKQLLNSRNNYIYYTINEKIYINDLDTDTLLSSALNSKQLINYPEQFYLTQNSNIQNAKVPWLLMSMILNFGLLAYITTLLYLKKKNKLQLEQNLDNESNSSISRENKNTKDYLQYLTNVEKDLLKLLVKNNLNNEKTSVSEINKILGTEKKEAKIQNNIRGEAILSINSKFMSFALVKDNLIERQRVEFDKRHVEYYINEKYENRFTLKLFSISVDQENHFSQLIDNHCFIKYH